MKLDKILVATDFSEGSTYALRAALEVARHAESELTLLHVIDLPDYHRATLMTPEVDAEAFRRSMQERTRGLLEEQIAATPEAAGQRVELRVGEGNAAEEINRVLADYDLLVISSHGRTGLEHVVIGSIAERVLRTASRPTLLIKRDVDGDWVTQGGGILVTTDLSPFSLEALDGAVELARRFGAPLTVVHVIEDLSAYPPLDWEHLPNMTPKQYRQRTEDLARAELKKILAERIPKGVEAVEVIRWGNAYLRITEEAKERASSMIVMATHGRTGFKRFFLGSVTERIARHVECPLLTVHAPNAS